MSQAPPLTHGFGVPQVPQTSAWQSHDDKARGLNARAMWETFFLAFFRGFAMSGPKRCWALAALLIVSSPAAAQQENQEVHQYGTQDILAGSRLYATNCQFCHGASGDSIAGVELAHQRFKRAATDDDLRAVIHNGVAAAGMPSFPGLERADLDGLVAYIRSGFDQGGAPTLAGDQSRGQALFAAKGCAGCHHAGGDGIFDAPDLAAIGAVRLPADIQRAILDPGKSILPINRPVHIVTRDGHSYDGKRVNEDTFTVQLIDRDRRLVLVEKTDIRDYKLVTTSAMPSYAGKLADQEMADLMAYLTSLKGP
jgi:putative heme-binding domain-containing protein